MNVTDNPAQAMAGAQREFEFLRPIVQGWLGKIAEARRSREGFESVARQCEGFYAGGVGFMWDAPYAKKYMGGGISPKFKITLNKAFEFVALYGPTLYWQNPVRMMKERKQIQYTPDMFGDPNNPMTMGIFQEVQRRQQQRSTQARIVTELLNGYLNYTPDEQPDGGLAQQSELAVTQALVTGLGLMWPKPYKMPGSNTQLTGSFYDSNKNLLIDPDACSMEDAWWICRIRTRPVWEVEREFGYPPGSLKQYANLESGTAQGESWGDRYNQHNRRNGQTNDLIRYYEIYSKMGIGARLAGVRTPLREALDRATGDYCYLAILDTLPFPLNAPSRKIRALNDISEVRKMFEWPIPFWSDSRWPCAMLSFYRHPESPWPVAPLAPGLGELSYMNIFMSQLAGRIWSASRDFIAVQQSALDFVKPAFMSGGDLEVFPIPDVAGKIGDKLEWIRQTEVNPDAWRIMEQMAETFEKRVGLDELMYGKTRRQSRTATDTEAKREALSVRPEYMSGKVEAWQTCIADMEKFCARWYVRGRDVVDLFGDIGAMLWEQHIVNAPVERVVREMRCTLEAGTARKPNKQRDAENIQTSMPVLLPELSKHADATGDTGPVNGLIRRLGVATDMEVQDILMGPRVPMPDPSQQEAQQQQAQMEAQKDQLELQGKALDNEGKEIDLQAKMLELQGKGGEVEGKQLELQFMEEEHDQKLDQSDEEHDQKLDQDWRTHLQNMLQQREQGRLKLQQAQAESQARVKSMQAQAAARPKTQSSNGNGSAK